MSFNLNWGWVLGMPEFNYFLCDKIPKLFCESSLKQIFLEKNLNFGYQNYYICSIEHEQCL